MCGGKIKTTKIIFTNRNTHMISKIHTANAIQQFRWRMQDTGHKSAYLNQRLTNESYDLSVIRKTLINAYIPSISNKFKLLQVTLSL